MNQSFTNKKMILDKKNKHKLLFYVSPTEHN